MKTEAMIELAMNMSSSGEELSKIVNVSVEIDRLLAAHPNTTPDTLKMIRSRLSIESEEDMVTCRVLVKNRNLPTDLLLDLAIFFPSEFWSNSAIDQTLLDSAEFVREMTVTLTVPECPTEVLEQVAEKGTRRQQLSALENPNLPLELKLKMTADYFFEQDRQKILVYAESIEDETIKDYVIAYSETSRPYCIPRFLPFDRGNPKHRLQDQLLSGFPFTTEKWPWPLDSQEAYMAPYAQLNLAEASAALGEDFGRGIFQVWSSISDGISDRFFTRVIPEIDLSEPMTEFYPSTTPWLNVGATKGIEILGWLSGDFDSSLCRVEWMCIGRMFYPTLRSRIFDCLETDATGVECPVIEDEDSLFEALELVDEDLEELSIPTSNSLQRVTGYYANFPFRLGGYADWKTGDEWLGDGHELLYWCNDFPPLVSISADQRGVGFTCIK